MVDEKAVRLMIYLAVLTQALTDAPRIPHGNW